ncbi:MAG TPA: hydroxymethylglutaryl-CoA reductase [Candidatus Polarisedimenticolaceae bacterium]|nr:hydroxymethylglutaryl-CoA reductase [Candidatus Polarisedimenticolaceae bacterium]
MSKVKVASPDAATSRDETIAALVDGSMRFHELPAEIPPGEATAIRREAVGKITGTTLDAIAHFSFDAGTAATRHCENLIGVAQIPMGIVGPITVHGDTIDGDVLIPMATTEGALLASINRGCAAIRLAGGATVYVEDVGMTRAPVFRARGQREARAFLSWIAEHETEIREVAEGTSRFLKMTGLRPYVFGTTIFLRFRFTTGDAMGMNMATIACDRVVRDLIEPKTGIPCVALSGNYCVDKKAASVNFSEGRGKRVHAEVVLDAAILRDVLKTDSRSLVEVQYRKNLLGSIAAGAMGYNAHYANVLSAFFIATGQDPAHVVGGSTGVTCIEPRENGAVYASIFIPDLPLGATGGGTGLATQSEALRVLGVVPDVDRPGQAALRLAEILGGAVLAGELSLMAAFTSSDLARAHQRLGRGGAEGDKGA